MTKILVTILGISVAGAVFFGYTRPTYDNVRSLQQENEQFDEALSRSRELQELRQSLLSRYNTFAGRDLTRLNNLLPDHVDNVRLVLDLDRMAAQYGMAIQNMIINRSDEGDGGSGTVIGSLSSQAGTYESLTMQFATVASYENFVRFLEDLESSLRIVDLTALSMEPVEVDEDRPEDADPLYQFNATIRTYWLR